MSVMLAVGYGRTGKGHLLEFQYEAMRELGGRLGAG